MISSIELSTVESNAFSSRIWLTIKQGFFTFGVITSLAVLSQGFYGTVEVPLVGALIKIGLIALMVSGVFNFEP